MISVLQRTPTGEAPPAGPFAFRGLTRFMPLIVGGGVFTVSILMAATGPIDWRFSNPGSVYGFLIACLSALVAGYLAAVLKKRRHDGSGTWQLNASLFLIVASVVYMVLFPFVTEVTTGKWFPDVIGALTDAGAAYGNNKRLNETAPPIALYLKILAGPLTVSILPVTLFAWGRLNLAARILGVSSSVLAVLLNIAQGTANGFAEASGVAILYFGLVAAASFSKERWRRIPMAVGAIVLIAALFLVYYSAVIRSRVAADLRNDFPGSSQVDEDRVSDRMSNVEGYGAQLRKDSAFFVVVPPAARPVGMILDNYLTQGYRGLSMAMEESFTPTYGLGFSEFFRHNVLRLVGQGDREPEIAAATYAGKISARGWGVGGVWGSFLIHPASDITFPGVVVLMVLIGFAWGASWRDLVTRGDPLAAVVFVHFFLLVFYLSANNQLFQGGERAVGFTTVLIAWLVLRSIRSRAVSSAPAESE